MRLFDLADGHTAALSYWARREGERGRAGVRDKEGERGRGREAERGRDRERGREGERLERQKGREVEGRAKDGAPARADDQRHAGNRDACTSEQNEARQPQSSTALEEGPQEGRPPHGGVSGRGDGNVGAGNREPDDRRRVSAPASLSADEDTRNETRQARAPLPIAGEEPEAKDSSAPSTAAKEGRRRAEGGQSAANVNDLPQKRRDDSRQSGASLAGKSKEQESGGPRREDRRDEAGGNRRREDHRERDREARGSNGRRRPELERPREVHRRHRRSRSRSRSRSPRPRSRSRSWSPSHRRGSRFGGGRGRYSGRSGLGGYSPRRRRETVDLMAPAGDSKGRRSPTRDSSGDEERKLPKPSVLEGAARAAGAAGAAVPLDVGVIEMVRQMADMAAKTAAAQAAAAAITVATTGTSPAVPSTPRPPVLLDALGVKLPLTPAQLSLTLPMLAGQLSAGGGAAAAATPSQTTRPARRLYVGNVPSTVSGDELMEFMNAAMLSASLNHLPASKPCINCTVNAEKSYGFAEFITAEDASAALALDGISLHGTTLKLRRPKDFYAASALGVVQAAIVADTVSSTVLDGPNKVFIGGVSPSLTAEKVKEIMTAFGQLRAFHMELNLSQKPAVAYAFLEARHGCRCCLRMRSYMDPVTTPAACIGLNGLQLAGKTLTVMHANTGAPSQTEDVLRATYDIPSAARPLLEEPTRILELKYLVSREQLAGMTADELAEFEDDIRLECARYGTVKSLHVVTEGATEAVRQVHLENGHVSPGRMLMGGGTMAAALVAESGDVPAELENGCRRDLAKEDHDGVGLFTSVAQLAADPVNGQVTPDIHTRGQSAGEQAEGEGLLAAGRPGAGAIKAAVDDASRAAGVVAANELGDALAPVQPANKLAPVKQEPQAPGEEPLVVEATPPLSRALKAEEGHDAAGIPAAIRVPEIGNVYVEYSREESACRAAHALLGRSYGTGVVATGYVSLRFYQKAFKKGLGARSHEEKQALALAALEHLCSLLLSEKDCDIVLAPPNANRCAWRLKPIVYKADSTVKNLLYWQCSKTAQLCFSVERTKGKDTAAIINAPQSLHQSRSLEHAELDAPSGEQVAEVPRSTHEDLAAQALHALHVITPTDQPPFQGQSVQDPIVADEIREHLPILQKEHRIDALPSPLLLDPSGMSWCQEGGRCLFSILDLGCQVDLYTKEDKKQAELNTKNLKQDSAATDKLAYPHTSKTLPAPQRLHFQWDESAANFQQGNTWRPQPGTLVICHMTSTFVRQTGIFRLGLRFRLALGLLSHLRLDLTGAPTLRRIRPSIDAKGSGQRDAEDGHEGVPLALRHDRLGL
eukprot:SM000116S24262  [mRNA]  locus=s116:329128:346415:- [translate_table: standard]